MLRSAPKHAPYGVAAEFDERSPSSKAPQPLRDAIRKARVRLPGEKECGRDSQRVAPYGMNGSAARHLLGGLPPSSGVVLGFHDDAPASPFGADASASR